MRCCLSSSFYSNKNPENATKEINPTIPTLQISLINEYNSASSSIIRQTDDLGCVKCPAAPSHTSAPDGTRSTLASALRTLMQSRAEVK